MLQARTVPQSPVLQRSDSLATGVRYAWLGRNHSVPLVGPLSLTFAAGQSLAPCSRIGSWAVSGKGTMTIQMPTSAGTFLQWWRRDSVAVATCEMFEISSGPSWFQNVLYSGGHYMGWYSPGEYRVTETASGADWICTVITWVNGGTCVAYKNGNIVGTKSSIATGTTTGATAEVSDGSCAVAQTVIWDRVLSHGEVRKLYREPWGMWTPPMRFAVPEQAAAGGSVVPIILQQHGAA